MSKNEVMETFKSFYKDMEKSINEEEVVTDLEEFLKISPNGQELVVQLLKVSQYEKGTMLGVDIRVINMAGMYTDYYLERKIA